MANASAITVVFGGLTSARDLSEVERICGTHEVRREVSHVGGTPNSRSATHQSEQVPVFRVGELRTLPEGTALVLWGRLPPLLAVFAPLDPDADYRRERRQAARRDTNPTAPADRTESPAPSPPPTRENQPRSRAWPGRPGQEQ